jgi:ABC-type Fe3+-citrate transport system substrate-binding protein
MGKKEKEHRKKVAKRNEEIKSMQKKLQKAQQDRIMQMIERENAEGKFDNPMVSIPGISGPAIDGPQI